jgi:hypothetical protein
MPGYGRGRAFGIDSLVREGLERGGMNAMAGIEKERFLSPARVSQVLSRALGHGYSRQSIVRLLESGVLAGHRMTPRGHWRILSSSVRAYIESIFGQNLRVRSGFGDVDQLVISDSSARRPV